jgi:hypothetical protein
MTGRQDDLGSSLRSLLLEEANAMPVDTHQAAEGLRGRIAHTRKRRRVTLAVAASVAAAAVVTVAATAGGSWLGADKEENPAQNPVHQAEAVARGFIDAVARYDAERAITYLTDDAVVDHYGSPERLRLVFALDRAVGYQEMIKNCEPKQDSPKGLILRCGFDGYALRSDEIGLGPYLDNNLWFTVHDGRIVSFSNSFPEPANGFDDQMWRPFAAWVSAEHPDDVQVMYEDAKQQSQRTSVDSVRLWEQRTAEYVAVVKQDPAEHLDQPEVAAYVAKLDSICAAAQTRVRAETKAIPQADRPGARDLIMLKTTSELSRSSVPEAVRWQYKGRVFPLMEKLYEYWRFGRNAEPPHDKQPPEWLARQIHQTPGLDKCIFSI